MNTRSFIPLFVLICLFSFNSYSQKQHLNGLVTTFDSLALVGADVRVKSTKQVIKTDSLGRFEVEIGTNDKLKIAAKGFLSKVIKVNEETKDLHINLKLKKGEKAKEYAIGYGYINDRDKLDALEQLTNEDNGFSNYTDMYNLINGRFSGVQVNSNGEIYIRGINSMNMSSAALIVVDGITVDKSIMRDLLPADVKSINILKGPSAAIYGARGANGVVIIETKKGKE